MKQFYFDTPVDRRGSGSYKWDTNGDSEVIPMWVADMDFKVAPCIIDALKCRVEHGVFGYTYVPDAYYEALNSWFTRRHGMPVNRSSVIYTSGVVPALSATIKGLTSPGDEIVVMTPVYGLFFTSIRNNKCIAIENQLIYTDDGYRIDFENLDACLSRSAVKLLILCNPHNPGGRVWTCKELSQVAQLCAAHGVTVISDEIHCEITFGDHHYTPFSLLARENGCESVTLCSPSKAFNTAGLQIANIIADNADIRAKIDRAINDNEVCDVNPFGVAGLISAYNEGEPWLNAMLDYVWHNYLMLADAVKRSLPALTLTPLEGTYLAWLDCRSTGMSSEQLSHVLLEKARLRLSSGTEFGTAGDGFLRINLACPHSTLAEALKRLISTLNNL